MVAVAQQVSSTDIAAGKKLTSSDRTRFMIYVMERSELTHLQAYRMSRVFDQLNLGLVTQQLAAFDRVDEYRHAASVVDWDQSLRQWIEVENRARAEISARNGVSVVYLPTPTARIGSVADSQQ